MEDEFGGYLSVEASEECEKNDPIDSREEDGNGLDPVDVSGKNDQELDSIRSREKNENELIAPPTAGTVFNSYDELVEYYARYGKQEGFGVRKRSIKDNGNGTKFFACITCSRNGHSPCDPKNILGRKNKVSRTNCKAKVNATILHDGRCRVNSVKLEHNHVMCPIKARYLKSHQSARIKFSHDDWDANHESKRYNRMCNEFYELAQMASNSDETERMVVNLIHDMKKKMSRVEVGFQATSLSPNNNINERSMVQDPLIARRCESPPTKMKESKCDEAVEKIMARKKKEVATIATDEDNDPLPALNMSKMHNVIETQQSINLNPTGAYGCPSGQSSGVPYGIGNFCGTSFNVNQFQGAGLMPPQDASFGFQQQQQQQFMPGIIAPQAASFVFQSQQQHQQQFMPGIMAPQAAGHGLQQQFMPGIIQGPYMLVPQQLWHSLTFSQLMQQQGTTSMKRDRKTSKKKKIVLNDA